MEFEIKKSTPTKPYHRHWQFCVGSGHAGLAMRTDYCRQLRFIHDELGIRRVRFHGIFSDDMHTLHNMKDVLPLPGGKRFTEQSFRLCGLVYDNVLACGMQPFVELSFMPRLLAKKRTKGLFYYKPVISMPKSDTAWTNYIQDFVRFLLRRYGEQEVEGWFFEVWNEPDLRIAFFAGSQQDYFHLYEITARAIKTVHPKLKVGGPATSGSRWVADFVRFCKQRDVPVDFVSTHQYAGDPLGGVQEGEEVPSATSGLRLGRLLHPFKGMPDGTVLDALRRVMGDKSETEDVPDYVFARNAPIVKEQAAGLPVYYNEWNENATFSAHTNDTRKVAAYDVRTSLAVEDSVTGSAIWCFSDIFEELHPFPEEFHGGFGLLSQHGIPKPVFHAFKWLAGAGDARYVLPGALDGEISLAAFRAKDAIQLLLVRQKMKNLDLPKERARVTLELEREPKSVTVQRIDEHSGNPLKAWQEMGGPIDLTPAEMADITQKTAVRETEMPYTYKDGKLEILDELGVNDLSFIQIEL